MKNLCQFYEAQENLENKITKLRSSKKWRNLERLAVCSHSSPDSKISETSYFAHALRRFRRKHCRFWSRRWRTTKKLASPLYLRNREDCESSRMPIAPGKLAALFSGERSKCKAYSSWSLESRKLDVKFVSITESIGETCCNVFIREAKNREINSRVLFSNTLTRQIWKVSSWG